VYELDESFENRRIGFRENAVSEIEDVTRSAPALENIPGFLFHDGPRREDNGWIEVSLDGAPADPFASDVERHAPIDAHDIGTRCRHLR
jgi:hypothetical protein